MDLLELIYRLFVCGWFHGMQAWLYFNFIYISVHSWLFMNSEQIHC